MTMSRLTLGLLLATSMIAAAGCAADPASDDNGSSSEDALTQLADDEWFYSGPMPALQNAKITVSLKGNTAHVTGFVDASVVLPADLPHVKTKPAGTRTQVDVVYPIATAAAGHSNSSAGTYSFYEAKPYRPDGLAYTVSAGSHFVTWGGFPFLGYNDGIAFHGPITSEINGSGESVWFLRRGAVSSGCNRMNGEHVVELAHMLGISMRKTYGANQSYANPSAAKVTVSDDYDMLDGKYIDVDYATDTGVVRPGVTYGDDKVTMFGSWIASVAPDGKDLPPDMKWEGGVNGKPYVFADHARADMVCSFAKKDLAGVKKLVAEVGGELPRTVCQKKQCISDAIAAGNDAKAACSL
jgi:hypothetical protein